MEFFLRKAGHPNLQRQTVPDGTVAEFPIPSVSREDGGSYTCDYRSIADQSRSSHPSEPVEIIVGLGEPSYPKPNISLLSPSGGVSLGGSVAIQCRGQRQGVRFVLNKEGRHFPPVDSAAFEVVFPISNVSREHGGSYSCSYHSRSEPFAVSYPSDPVELVVRELPAPRPSISISPSGVITLGGAVIIRCQCRCEVRRLFLYKGGIQIRELDADGDGGEFTIPSARREHGGVYTCQSRSRSEPPDWSDPSDIMQIIVVETTYSKPSISLRPSGGVALGGAVTVRCQGWYQNVRFLLYKDGNPNALQDAEPAGDLAEFPISNVSRRDAGSYSCYYHHKLYPFIWSYPSDPVELVVAEGSYPKPSISVSPGGVIPMRGNVTIRCRHQRLGMRFLLYKAGDGNYLTYTDPAGSEAEFPITSARREHGGSYTCSYSNRTGRAAYSEPSDPVQIIVADLSLPRPSIALSPTGVTAPGADTTIRCQGQRRDMRFFLHKAKDLNAQRHMDPAGDGAEFHIPTVGRQHGGNYSCSYRHRSEPFISSQPSDPVELVVAEPTLPKPSVSIRPSQGVALRGAATIRCQARLQNATFLLFKDGGYWGCAAPVGNVAEFPVIGAGWRDAGSYSCSYHTTREPVAVSHPSDPARLVVRDYTRVNIVRLVLSAGVLLALALILAEAALGWKRGGH
ncbi:immunoglobulin superfamily member 1-like [Malaclemys terrapin pileata]|uniref:immunoglobulin superfamily member 1-like n=1 Tax=Malaclemys terrapin pileata TaxID=2991368 RepID=UPI0023A836EB|nr:immunoglobulin superfamily member 1-like [Malaclemys terrapin pileata]